MFETEKLSAERNGHRVEIEVLRRLGASLSSFKIDGRELIWFSKERLIAEQFHNGCFFMFPTPCRLTDAQYDFGGKHIDQRKHNQPVPSHGLIRDETFDVTRTADSLLCRIEIDEQHSVFEGYPFQCVFSLEFILIERGLEIRFTYENTGTEDAPFGFGLHPFWIIPANRNDVFIKVPCDQTMELADLIPTGNTSKVEGTDLDLRSFRCLGQLDIDNVFCGRDPNGEHAIEYRDLGEKLVLYASDIFGHMIAYTPADEPFVCMENLTCCPDAPNVYARGGRDVSGLQVVRSGETLQGWVRYVLTDM